MKIEVEIEDKFYHALREIVGDVDIGVAVSEMLKTVVVLYGSDPDRFMQAYDDRESEAAKSLDSQIKGLIPRIVDKAKKEKE